ncbi:hypothetical protein MMC13_002366 [Lambiella insularis]|nr:hypothetical protein [Lambiella insularis]
MAYSPTPGPSQARRLSVTPPLLSKRDKRRNAIEQRMKDLDFTFMSHREQQSRAQLNLLSRDIAFINRADLYDTKPLEDYADDMGAELILYGGDNGLIGLRGGTGGPSDTDGRPSLGKYAAKFVQDVNDSMEHRDTELTEVMNRFQQKAQTLMEECEFSIAVAKEEHKLLQESVRERKIASVQAKKKSLEKEKSLLDVADSSALLLHPTQFTITRPASPGGAQSNRKTRYTRHRLEMENPETNGEVPRRKRKAPADFDNGSPGTISRIHVDNEGSSSWDRNYTSLEQQQVTAPVQSINQLFNTKDLQLVTRAAIETVGQHWAKRAKPLPSSGKATGGNTSDIEDRQSIHDPADRHSEDEINEEMAATLVAPMMERGGSYATRSTRKDETAHLYESFDGSRQEALRCFGLAAVGAHMRMLRTKDDIPFTAPLNGQEIMDDVAIFEAAKQAGVY